MSNILLPKKNVIEYGHIYLSRTTFIDHHLIDVFKKDPYGWYLLLLERRWARWWVNVKQIALSKSNTSRRDQLAFAEKGFITLMMFWGLHCRYKRIIEIQVDKCRILCLLVQLFQLLKQNLVVEHWSHIGNFIAVLIWKKGRYAGKTS